MMGRAASINALFTRIEKEFPEIEREYNKCIIDMNITASLQTNIYDFLNHNRSILDYIAKEISAMCLQKKQKGMRINFPIAPKKVMKGDFEKNFDRHFPGLKVSRPDIYDYLINIQYFNGNDWLPEFMELVNDNKHNELSPQTTSVYERILTSFEDCPYKMPIGEGGFTKRVDIKEGGKIVFELPDGQTKEIRGPQELTANTTHFDDADSGAIIEREKWIEFKFDISNSPAISLLKNIKDNVRKIYSDLDKII